MFDALRLLDQFVGAGTADRVNQMTGGRLGEFQNTLQTGGLGGLVDQARNMVGQGATQVAEQGQGFASQVSGQAQDLIAQAQNAYTTGGVQGVLDQGKSFLQQNATGLFAGAAAAGIGALLLGTRTGRSVGGAALKLGGLALVGGLAYKALQSWQAGRQPQDATPDVAPAPLESGFASNAVPDAQERALVAIRAMIAAAKADGHIDAAEQQRILGRFAETSLDAEARAFLEQEMAGDSDIDSIIMTATTVERSVELYAASVVAIDPDTAEEQTYLDELASRLGLNAELRAHLDAQATAIRNE